MKLRQRNAQPPSRAANAVELISEKAATEDIDHPASDRRFETPAALRKLIVAPDRFRSPWLCLGLPMPSGVFDPRSCPIYMGAEAWRLGMNSVQRPFPLSAHWLNS